MSPNTNIESDFNWLFQILKGISKLEICEEIKPKLEEFKYSLSTSLYFLNQFIVKRLDDSHQFVASF